MRKRSTPPFRPERPVLSAQAEGLGTVTCLDLGPERAVHHGPARTGERRFQRRNVNSSRYPGLRPGLTEPASQAGNAQRSSLRCFGIAVLALLFASTVASAQEKEVRLSFEGPEVFCHVLHQFKLEPIKSFDLTEDPTQSMVILFGDPHVPAQLAWVNEVAEFARRGGNVLVATDHHFQGLGVFVPGSKIVQPEGNTYGGEARCPLLSFNDHEPAHEHPIFMGLHKNIATNCPSHVRIRSDDLVDLLNFPPQAKREGGPPPGFAARPGRPAGNRFAYLVGPQKDSAPAGRIIVIAGNGVFMNGMMLQTDNANFDFAANVVRWLREGPNGQTRARALFVVDGNLVEDFNMNLSPPAPPLPTPTVTMLNRLIRGLENERFFHHLLGDLMRGDWNRLLTILLSVVTLALVAYGAKKVLQGRHAPETAVPSVVGPVESNVAPSARDARDQVKSKTDSAKPRGGSWFGGRYMTILKVIIATLAGLFALAHGALLPMDLMRGDLLSAYPFSALMLRVSAICIGAIISIWLFRSAFRRSAE